MEGKARIKRDKHAGNIRQSATHIHHAPRFLLRYYFQMRMFQDANGMLFRRHSRVRFHGHALLLLFLLRNQVLDALLRAHQVLH